MDAPSTSDTTRLTDRDRRIIDRGRRLAEASGLEAIRRALADSGIDSYAEAFGVARYLLDELADLAERLGGSDA